MRLLFLAALVAMTAGCTSDAQREGSAVRSDSALLLLPSEVEVDTTVSDSAAVYPGVDLAAILARASERDADGELAVLREMNPPLRTEREPVVNRHDASLIDTVRTLYYSGLRIVVYEVSASGREMVQEVEVTGGPYRTADGLGIGSTRAEVQEVVGEPTSMEDTGSMYELYDGPDDPTPTVFTVAYAGDRAIRMNWSFYVD